MPIFTRIEQSLEQAVALAQAPGAPPRLAAALHYSVFPAATVSATAVPRGGAGLRRQRSGSASAAAAAIELLHCASLVHDDLPSFDNAAIRRGKPSVHVEFGEPLAVLAGDALIVMAFETLARHTARSPGRLATLISVIARCVGAPHGIVAGQRGMRRARFPQRLPAGKDRITVRCGDNVWRSRRGHGSQFVEPSRRDARRSLSGR